MLKSLRKTEVCVQHTPVAEWLGQQRLELLPSCHRCADQPCLNNAKDVVRNALQSTNGHYVKVSTQPWTLAVTGNVAGWAKLHLLYPNQAFEHCHNASHQPEGSPARQDNVTKSNSSCRQAGLARDQSKADVHLEATRVGRRPDALLPMFRKARLSARLRFFFKCKILFHVPRLTSLDFKELHTLRGSQ